MNFCVIRIPAAKPLLIQLRSEWDEMYIKEMNDALKRIRTGFQEQNFMCARAFIKRSFNEP